MEKFLVAKSAVEIRPNKFLSPGESIRINVFDKHTPNSAIFSNPDTRKQVFENLVGQGADRKCVEKILSNNIFEVRDVNPNPNIVEKSKSYSPLSNRDLNKPLW